MWDCAAELHRRRVGIDKRMMRAVASFAGSWQAVGSLGTQPGLRMPGSCCIVIHSVHTSWLDSTWRRSTNFQVGMAVPYDGLLLAGMFSVFFVFFQVPSV